MAIEQADNVQTGAPKPTDSRYYNNLVPYTGDTEANLLIDSGVRYTGLTVNIAGTEWWYKNGIEDGDLIPKENGGGTLNMSGDTVGGLTTYVDGTTICANDYLQWDGSILQVSGNTTETRAIQIGHGRADSGYAYIDLIGDTTYTDYGLRVLRSNSGENTVSIICHRGTGDLRIESPDGGDIKLRDSGTTRLSTTATGIDVCGELDVLGPMSADTSITINRDGDYGAYQVFRRNGALGWILHGGTGAGLDNFQIRNSGSTNLFGITQDGIVCANTCLATPAFQLTTGAASGCVLQSDGSGNASWATPSGGGGVAVSGTTNDALTTYISASGDICAEPNLKFDGTSLHINGKIGFCSGAASDTCINILNTTSGAGKQLCISGQNVFGTTTDNLIGGKLYILGGDGTNTSESGGCGTGGDVVICAGSGAIGDGVGGYGGNVKICGGGGNATIGGTETSGDVELYGGYNNTYDCGHVLLYEGLSALKFETKTDGVNVTGKMCTDTIQISTGAGAGCILCSDASGNGTWVTPSGGGATDLSIGSSTGTVVRIDSSTGTNATLPLASATVAGVVSNTTQTFAGTKTTTVWCGSQCLRSAFIYSTGMICAGGNVCAVGCVNANTCVQVGTNICFDQGATRCITVATATDGGIGDELHICAGGGDSDTSPGTGGNTRIYGGDAGGHTGGSGGVEGGGALLYGGVGGCSNGTYISGGNGGTVHLRGGQGGTAAGGAGGAGGITYVCGGPAGPSGSIGTGQGGHVCIKGGNGSGDGCVFIYNDTALKLSTTGYGTLTTGTHCASTSVCTPLICVNGSGGVHLNVSAACGSALDWIATSDCRIKKNIEPITSALSKVDALCGVCYELCEDGTPDMGLIAQEVICVEPRLVACNEVSEEYKKYGIEDQMLGLKYDKFAGLFVEAIKELKQQNECLQLQINELRKNN